VTTRLKKRKFNMFMTNFEQPADDVSVNFAARVWGARALYGAGQTKRKDFGG
jgi:hypothetical protein